MTAKPPNRLPQRPQLELGEDGVPRALDYDDVYYSVVSGLAEAKEVFFRGCGLPEQWAGKERFTIAELGFGTGLNMAAVADLWAQNRPSENARLHLVSIEGRLMSREDAREALSPWKAELGEILEALLGQWPQRARGVQQVNLLESVHLTVIQDEVDAALRSAQFLADAWFLDGFSPANNDEMWSASVMHDVARLSAPGAVVGTYTVAGYVRRNLADAGFDVSKQPGFGKKRERLEAVYPGIAEKPSPDPYLLAATPENPQSVIVVGAGAAGAAIAHRFADRGARTLVLDSSTGVDAGTSANPLGLVMPRLDAEDTPSARAMQDAYLRARLLYSQFPDAAYPIDIRQPAKDDKATRRYEKILSDPPFDHGLLTSLDAAVGLLHCGAYVASPVELRRVLLSDICVRWGVRIRAVRPGAPAVVELENAESLEADLVVIAAGMGIPALLGKESPPLSGRAGQLEWMPCTSPAPSAYAGGRYAIHLNDILLFGASFTPHDSAEPPIADENLRKENIEGLFELSHELAKSVETGALTSRTGVRATTPDRTPFVGRLPQYSSYCSAYGDDLEKGRPLSPQDQPLHSPGIMIAGGLGARGFTWAPLLADIAVALSYGDPRPTGRASLETLSPARFLMRELKRGIRRRSG